MIYTGTTAEEILEINLAEDYRIETKGYFKEGNRWVAFDNSTGDCFIEGFAKEKEAIAWVENYFDMSEYEDFKIFKLFKGLYYIPKKGFLRVKFLKQQLTTKLYRLRLSIRLT